MPSELTCPAPGTIAWRDYEDGPLPPASVRIRAVLGAEKHGTSAEFVAGHGNRRGGWDDTMKVHRPGKPLMSYPFTLGNQVVGEVVEIGTEVTKRHVGQRVMGYAGFRPTITASEDWGWALAPGVRSEDALCLDPAVFALGAIRDGQVRIGDAVAVMGLGAIGLVAVALLRRAGAARIIVTDPVAKRLDLAKRIGATDAIPSGGDTGLRMKELTGGRGPDVIIDYSGAMQAIQAALRGIAYGGTVVMGAFPSPWPAGLDMGGEAHMNRVRLVSSRACSDPNPDHPRWDFARITTACMDLISDGAIPGALLLDPVVRFEELIEAYPRVALDPGAGVKMGVRYG